MKHTYTVSAGNADAYYPVWVDAETLTICENYALSWTRRGPGHWAEIISDDTGEVVAYHESPAPEKRCVHDVPFGTPCAYCQRAQDAAVEIVYGTGHVPSVDDLLSLVGKPVIISALALVLALPLTTHAAPIASAPGPSCAYSTPTQDEGAIYAVCPDGTAYYLDRDGQPFPNAAGVPVRPPGWVRLA